MTLWDAKAANLQFRVRSSEGEEESDYPESQVRRSIVHTRDDVILLVSHIASINGQLSAIRGLLLMIFLAIVVVGAAIVYRMYY